LRHHLCADPPFVLEPHVLLRQEDCDRRGEVLQLNEIDCGTTEVVVTSTVGSSSGTSTTSTGRPPALTCKRRERAAPVRDFVDDRPAQLGRNRFGGIQRRLPGSRIEHRQPAGQVATQLVEHVGLMEWLTDCRMTL